MRNFTPKSTKHKTTNRNINLASKTNDSFASEYFHTVNDSLNILENAKTPVRNFMRSEALKRFRKSSLDSLRNTYNSQNPNEQNKIETSPNPSLYFTCDGDVLGEHCSIYSNKATLTPIKKPNTDIITSTPISAARSVRKGYDKTIFSVAKCRKIDLQNLSPMMRRMNGNFFFFKIKLIASFLINNFYSTDSPTSNKRNAFCPKTNNKIFNQQLHESISPISSIVCTDKIEKENVLKKIISISVDQFKNKTDKMRNGWNSMPKKIHFNSSAPFEGKWNSFVYYNNAKLTTVFQ